MTDINNLRRALADFQVLQAAIKDLEPVVREAGEMTLTLSVMGHDLSNRDPDAAREVLTTLARLQRRRREWLIGALVTLVRELKGENAE